MEAEILVLKYRRGHDKSTLGRLREGFKEVKQEEFRSFVMLIEFLFKKANREEDTGYATVIVIDSLPPTRRGESKLDMLDLDKKKILLNHFFGHLNVILASEDQIRDEEVIMEIRDAMREVNILVGERLSRMGGWTGTQNNLKDETLEGRHKDQGFSDLSLLIPSMPFVLNQTVNRSNHMSYNLRAFSQLIMTEIDFFKLLSLTRKRQQQLCHAVGHWSFPAHEMNNDELSYCVYLILQYALKDLRNSFKEETQTLYFPSPNELLGIVFMIRNCYNCGNPFHNFRHATDVLQACFQYVIRLECLPKFVQFEEDPRADDLRILNDDFVLYPSNELEVCERDGSKSAHNSEGGFSDGPRRSISSTTTTRIAMSNQEESSDDPVLTSKSTVTFRSSVQLDTLQVFGLLVAALGHDVGHPGVTNTFLNKFSSPMAQIYNERSVLELYHACIFVNKLLAVCWPSLLDVRLEKDSDVKMKDLFVSSILATDMAEHFEYIAKIAHTKNSNTLGVTRVKLLSSLLIKCADISNITRPLRISSQWALTLAREFDELSMLERNLLSNISTVPCTLQSDDNKNVPATVNDVLRTNPNLHASQLFFIDNFGEVLFSNIIKLLPELKFTHEFVQENKHFWQSRGA